MRNRLHLLFATLLITSVIWNGCESCGNPDYELRAYRDNFSLSVAPDTFTFGFGTMYAYLQSPETVTINPDPSLSDSVRFELDLEIGATRSTIVRSRLDTSWSHDTVVIMLDYNSNGNTPPVTPPIVSKKGSSSAAPQCQPAEDGDHIRVISAQVFLPPGKHAKYTQY